MEIHGNILSDLLTEDDTVKSTKMTIAPPKVMILQRCTTMSEYRMM